MPRPPKLSMKAAAEGTKKTTVQAARYKLVNEAVQASTLKMYAGLFRRMEEYRGYCSVGQWSEDLFVQLLNQVSLAGYADGEVWRSALIHFLTAKGLPTDFLRTPGVLKMTKGIKLRSRMQGRQPGTLSLHMMKDFVKWLEDHGKVHLAPLAIVLYEGQLRSCEAKLMLVGDTQKDNEHTGVIILRIDKRVNRKTISARGYRLIKSLESGKAVGAVLLAEAEAQCREIRACIKQAADDLKWPEGFQFSGPTQGGTRPLIERAALVIAEGFANQTGRTLKHYTKRAKN